MNIDLSQMTADLVAQEALLAAGDYEPAVQTLAAMAADAEEYVDRNCPTTEQVQYFSFPSLFDRLAYRRVEHDPRTLKPVGEPLDRLYGDLAFGLVATGDYPGAMGALKHAVRWNPMGCGYRLDLAELYRIAGDVQEYLALTFSVFARASEVEHLLRAYVNFARWFGDTGRPDVEAACLVCALRFETPYEPLDELVAAVAGTPADPAVMDFAAASQLVEAEGLPDGANADIVVCLLMCATDAAAQGDRALATRYILKARNLVGEDACALLLDLIRSSETAPDAPQQAPQDASGE